MTQAKTRPPTFVVCSRRCRRIAAGKLRNRYLINSLRETFSNCPVFPLRLLVRKGQESIRARFQGRGPPPRQIMAAVRKPLTDTVVPGGIQETLKQDHGSNA